MYYGIIRNLNTFYLISLDIYILRTVHGVKEPYNRDTPNTFKAFSLFIDNCT